MTKKSGYQTENIGHSDITTYVYMVFTKRNTGKNTCMAAKLKNMS